MLIEKNRVCHLSSVNHEGKVVLVATDASGALWYTVRQDGFEGSYQKAPPEQRTGWEGWKELPLPDEAEDASVLAREKEEFTLGNDPAKYLLRSLYRSRTITAIAPVQLVSAGGHLYVFRQSASNTLLVDRLVLNGMTNELVRKLEVRHRRSKQRYPGEQGGSGPNAIDTLDYRDLDGNYFYEPTTEVAVVSDLVDGWFSVVLTPTNEHEVFRWHIFAYNAALKRIEIVSIRASEEGLFDVSDGAVYEPRSTTDPTLAPRVVPGIIRRALDLGGRTVQNAPSATRYDLQRECAGEKRILLRTATRVLLAIPTDEGTVALSFSIAADGTLSRIEETARTELLRFSARDVLLPVDTLADIVPVGDVTPPPQGTISGVAIATDAQGAEDRVVMTSPEAASLHSWDQVQIRGTTGYDGVYVVSAANDGTFEIAAPFAGDAIGVWEKVEAPQQGLRFDGMITSFERTAGGKLKITAIEHRLENGDEVQLLGTKGHDGVYPVSKLDDTHFIVDRVWPMSEAINLRAVAHRRRGLLLDGRDDHVELSPDSLPAGDELTISLWAKGGGSLPKDATLFEALDGEGRILVRISIPDANGRVVFECGRDGNSLEKVDKDAAPEVYRDQWVHWAFVRSAATQDLKIYRNGVVWIAGKSKGGNKDRPLGPAAKVRLGASTASSSFYHGEVSDLRIFGRALGEDEIRRGMHEALSGRELGLFAYFRLSAVLEGDPRAVVDFSQREHDGVVSGGAYVGAASLPRKLLDGTLAVKYTNRDPVSVVEGATYIESFEFRVNAAAPATPATLRDADGRGNPLFRLSCWGSRGRGDEARLPVAVVEQPFVDLGDGWFRAEGRFIVPAGIAAVRCFEIAEVRGEFVSIDVRKHRIREIAGAVTQANHADAPALRVLSDNHADLTKMLERIRQREHEEVRLLAEQAGLEDIFDALARMEETKERLDDLKAAIKALELSERQLADDHARAVQSPFNYELWITNAASGPDERVRLVQRSSKLAIEIRPSADAPAERWRFAAVGDGSYYLYNVGAGAQHRVSAVDGSPVTLEIRPAAEDAWQRWKVVPSAGGHTIYNVGSGETRRLHATKRGSVWELEIQSNGNDARQEWRFASTGTASNTVVADTLAAWTDALARLKAAKAEEVALEAAVKADEPQRVAWRTRLAQIVAELGQIRAELAGLNVAYLAGLRATSLAPQAMPPVATDSRGLVTQGAVLGFVRAASRLQALEICEGNVQLSYFDEQGRIRLTQYDASADGRNATFEQWIPEGQRACVHFGATPGASARLSTPIDLPSAWTMEAWITAPLPPEEWSVIAANHDGSECPIAVLGGRYLGQRSQGFFFGGEDLSGLEPGWHHIAALRSGGGPDATVAFHVDGARVGDARALRHPALGLDGVDDAVSLAGATIPAGAEITVAFWARTDTSRESTVIEAVDAANLRVLSIGLPGPGGAIVFDCGNDGAGFDRIEKQAQRAEYHDGWVHLAFTKHAATGVMKIYRNGRLWHRAIGKRMLLPASVKAFVGRSAAEAKSYFEGQIAELRVYARELGAGEILALAAGVGTEEGLVGRFSFAGGGAIDSSASGLHGTLLGAPQALVVAAGGTHQLVHLGSSGPVTSLLVPTSSGEAIGKLAEFRLWGVPLSDEEIAVNAKTLLTGNEPGLLAYYPMNEAKGVELRDLCGVNGPAHLIADTSLPTEDRPRALPDDSPWWACTSLIGNRGSGVIAFDGENDQLTAAPGLVNDLAAFTIEGWVRPSSLPGGVVSLFGQRGTIELGLAERKPHAWTAMGGSLTAPEALAVGPWRHVAVVGDGEALTLFVDGVQVAAAAAAAAAGYGASADPFTIGAGVLSSANGGSNPFHGRIADVRVWTRARTPLEIRATMYERLTGQEPDLVAYFPLDAILPGQGGATAHDISPHGRHALAGEALAAFDLALPIGCDALVSAEYRGVAIDPAIDKPFLLMRRGLAAPTPEGAWLLSEKRIEALELTWIGNAQFAPTLLGYIEGAPPIPSENLTESDDYNGATAVELTSSEDVEFRWNRSDEFGLGGRLDLFVGYENEVNPFGASVVADVRIGLKANLDFSLRSMHETNITSQSSMRMVDRLELRGTAEYEPKFPELGRRFIPKNVGYALVVSGLGDMYVTRLARTGKMLNYHVKPVEGAPPHVNTVTFLMNPAYTMQGSLDGMTGSRATSDRYFKHVPQLRSQYGALQPASYYRPEEAWELERRIALEDKQREAYYEQFAIKPGHEEFAVPETGQGGGIDRGPAPSHWPDPMKQAWAQGDEPPPGISSDLEDEWRDLEKSRMKEQAKERKGESSSEAEAALKKVETLVEKAKAMTAELGYEAWQKKMEDILIDAGKRNIVNIYVWDADGGLRAEGQSFASTAEHTIGGSFFLDAALGLEAHIGVGGAKVELTPMATVNMTQTVRKTEVRSKGIDLQVDLSGVESTGVTDYDDRPLMPGEKVDRYRFMSFYLAGSTGHYNDFFRFVVDPNWLRSNDEEAEVLRQAMGKPNKAWRVLHRVTYVERLAGLAVGRDLRPYDREVRTTRALTSYFDELSLRQQMIDAKMNEILRLLAEKEKP